MKEKNHPSHNFVVFVGYCRWLLFSNGLFFSFFLLPLSRIRTSWTRKGLNVVQTSVTKKTTILTSNRKVEWIRKNKLRWNAIKRFFLRYYWVFFQIISCFCVAKQHMDFLLVPRIYSFSFFYQALFIMFHSFFVETLMVLVTFALAVSFSGTYYEKLWKARIHKKAYHL